MIPNLRARLQRLQKMGYGRRLSPTGPESTPQLLATEQRMKMAVNSDSDIRHTWDAGNDKQVKNAENMFKDMTKAGFKAYAIGTPGGKCSYCGGTGLEPENFYLKGEAMKKFDPEAGGFVFVGE